MLANSLARKYNKDINVDIELTPEEVLMVKEGVNEDVAEASLYIVDSNQEDFTEKIKSVNKELMKALYPAPASEKDTEAMPLRYLLFLEREAYIFFSLIGGITARYVLRSALRKYGAANSEIYLSPESRKNMMILLNHIRVLVRAIGRIGQKEDLILLEDVRKMEKEFMRLGEGSQYMEKVRQLMNWIDESQRNIIKAGS
jgi:hypothetical protein